MGVKSKPHPLDLSIEEKLVYKSTKLSAKLERNILQI